MGCLIVSRLCRSRVFALAVVLLAFFVSQGWCVCRSTSYLAGNVSIGGACETGAGCGSICSFRESAASLCNNDCGLRNDMCSVLHNFIVPNDTMFVISHQDLDERYFNGTMKLHIDHKGQYEKHSSVSFIENIKE